MPCNATASVSLIEPGTLFESRYNQVDLRLTKTVRLGRARLQGMADAYNVFRCFARPWKMHTIRYRHKEKDFRLLQYDCYGFDCEKYYSYPEIANGVAR